MLPVAPGSTAGLQMTAFPDTMAGIAHSFTVTAEDAYGNTNVNYAGTVSFISSDVAALLPASYTFVATDAGVHTFIATLKTAGTQGLTAQDGTHNLIVGQSGIVVQAGALSKLTLAPQAGGHSAGVAGNATLSATDAFANPIAGYTGTVHFASSDPRALLPADYTFTPADQGTHSFSMTLKTAGTQSIFVTDLGNANLGSTTNVQVAPGSTVSLQMSTIPNTVAGTAHTFTIIAVDAFGNTNVNYAGTITFSSSDVAAQLPASYTFVATDAGTRTFSATLKTAGNQSLTVQDLANHLSASQNGIPVSAAAASALALSGSPNNARPPDVSFSFAVSALDAFGNVIASGFGDTVHFSSSDLPEPRFRATIRFRPRIRVRINLAPTLMTAGKAETLTVTDTSVGSVTSARASIVIQTGPTAKFLISVAAGTVAGVALSPIIKAYDVEDNPTPNYTGTIHFSSSDTGAVLPADYAFLGSDQGSKSFGGVLFKTAGAQSLTVTDVADTALTGSQNNIAVSPAGAASLQSPALSHCASHLLA